MGLENVRTDRRLLLAESEEFAAWWPRHDVAAFEEHERIFHHPTAGDRSEAAHDGRLGGPLLARRRGEW